MGIDPRSDRPVYRQLADLLRADIVAGTLAPGTTLASETRMAQDYGVGREAVRQAIAVLRGEGLVSTERGRGTWVRQPAIREPVPLRRGDRAVARMPTPEEIRDLDLDEGVPVIEVRRGARTAELHPADRTEIIAR